MVIIEEADNLPFYTRELLSNLILQNKDFTLFLCLFHPSNLYFDSYFDSEILNQIMFVTYD